MARLYPPYLEGTLPAFWLNKEGNGLITIPFAFNKAVSSADITSFAVRVKTVQNDILLAEVNIDSKITSSNVGTVDKTTSAGYWDIEETRGGGNICLAVKEGYIIGTEAKLIVGQFYKIQIAFKDAEGDVGYYSTVGVIKCTSKPILYIDGFSLTKANNNNTEFVGVFEQPRYDDSDYSGDITEKVYSCNFKIYNEDKEVVYESGEMIHSVENNVSTYESEDHWRFFWDLEDRKVYTIVYSVITNNNLKISSPEYLLVEQRSIPNGFESLQVHTKLCKENGYIAISLSASAEELIAGMFVLSRADTQDPYYWIELNRFGLHGEVPQQTDIIYKDFTIEQGKTYIYRIRRYNTYGIYSEAIESDKIYADFDHIFIYDGERQLKVAFNPQVSNFKTQLAESRSETIGGKYPFFFRNARVGYKTFPVSGLISMQMDDNELFTTYDSILRTDYRSPRYYTGHSGDGIAEAKKHSDLINENFASERLFKLKVLDWLNDGKVKLFRSPGEGNYLVRLMDVSLTPNTTVGRMLHTFNATAYECAPINYDSFVEYKIITPIPKEDIDDYIIQWRKIDFTFGSSEVSHHYYVSGDDYSKNLFETDILNGFTNNIELKHWLPGTHFRLITDAGGEATAEGIDVIIGPTGSYYVDNIQNIYGIYWKKTPNIYDNNLLANGGIISYQYQNQLRDDFNMITEMEIDMGSLMQIVGKGLDYELVSDYLEVVDYKADNPVKLSRGIGEMPFEQVSKLFDVKIFKRPIEYVYYIGEDIFDGEDKLDKVYWSSYAILDPDNYQKYSRETALNHSPFGLFVIKNLSEGENGDSVLTHRIANSPTKYHGADTELDHFNEGPFIDKWLMKQTAEEELLYNVQPDINITTYVIDPWMNKIYYSGTDDNLLRDMFLMEYNKDERESVINLREIEQLSLSDLTTKISGGESADNGQSIVKLGIGLYAQVLYSKITTSFSPGLIKDKAKKEKIAWEKAVKNGDFEAERIAYAKYINAVRAVIEEWTKKDYRNYYMRLTDNQPDTNWDWPESSE